MRLNSLRIFATFLLLSSIANANSVHTEQLYDQYAHSLDQFPALAPSLAISATDKKLFTDALWDAITVQGRTDLQEAIKTMEVDSFSIADRLRLMVLRSYPHSPKLPRGLIEGEDLDVRSQLILSTYFDIGPPQAQPGFRAKTREELQDLFFRSPLGENYRDGRYVGGVRIFMFCRHKRIYKCRLLLKNADGEVVRRPDGSLWSQPALGLSRLRLPYNKRNGYTPSGIYTIDSVMPEANKPAIYGQFRRLMIHFLPKRSGESANKTFLPPSAHDKSWWKEAVVARDIGRNLLRIHGTGVVRSTPVMPFTHCARLSAVSCNGKSGSMA